MANATLFATACALLLAHVALLGTLCRSNETALQAVYVLGPLAGVWNHGTTSAAARWTDRIAMVVGLGVDLYYVAAARLPREGDRAGVACLLALAVLAYAASRASSSSSSSASAVTAVVGDGDGDGDGTRKDITTHLLAHALVLAAHAWLLLALLTTASPEGAAGLGERVRA
jgi:hypothetical protein